MKENLDFFKIQHNNIKPTRGRVLVAEPFLQDSYFKRSVVLLTEHNDEGSLGFVLNNPIDFEISEILKDFPAVGSLVSIGGPVRTDTVHYIHVAGDKIRESVPVFGSIFWGGDIEIIREGLLQGWLKQHEIRFFVGFSSWHSNQLLREIGENSWLVTRISEEEVMTGSGLEMWEQVLSAEESRYQMWARYPEDPMLN